MYTSGMGVLAKSDDIAREVGGRNRRQAGIEVEYGQNKIGCQSSVYLFMPTTVDSSLSLLRQKHNVLLFLQSYS